VEALLLAGGKGERLGDAAQGRPKALAQIAGRPLCSYGVAALARAGVKRVVVSCAAGREGEFERDLSGLGAEIVLAPEPEPLGRGGGLRFAARLLEHGGPVFALNADDLLALDYGALLAHHEQLGTAATITVTPMTSPFGVVDVSGDDLVTGFREAPRLPFWISCGVYVLDDEARERLPERGDHEQSTFPELAAEGKLGAFRYEGVWLTVNTPKDLRRAEEWVADNPEWLNTGVPQVTPGAPT
jgi:NDP-sugar pyrophosphorylase family protein